ncbi:MAG: hypothetical protein IJ678_05375, partial [Kiritimatiellae bacterium]|nr:hypothetical protein [Kiritimatiellia bacterium]
LAAASPRPMKWVGGRQNAFWFETDGESALAALRRVGREIRTWAEGEGTLFTQEAYLVVESGLDAEPGLEMGPFSLFPDLTDDEARRRRVHNVETLESAIRSTPARIAAVGGYSFAISCPSTDPLPEDSAERLHAAVREKFPVHRSGEVRFGQQGTPLDVRVR